MNKSVFSFSISIDVINKRKKKVHLFQETLTHRWLTTLLQIRNRHQQQTTAKPATNATNPSACTTLSPIKSFLWFFSVVSNQSIPNCDSLLYHFICHSRNLVKNRIGAPQGDFRLRGRFRNDLWQMLMMKKNAREKDITKKFMHKALCEYM